MSHTRLTVRARVIPSVVFITVLLVGVCSAGAITRNDVLSRAQVRVDKPVPYSQSRYYAGYRTDCSGYVSMCWSTGTSYSTRTIPLISTPIRAADLRPGDALNKRGYHVRLFYGWLDDAKKYYVAYESAGSQVAGARIHSLAEDLAAGYVPVRYNRIASSPTPSNILRNGGFDTWTRSWGMASDQPTWWNVAAGDAALAVKRNQRTYRTLRNSLRLSSSSEWAPSELSQTVQVQPSANYRLTAYVRTAFDPAAVRLRLTYLDATGSTVAEGVLTGDEAGLVDGSFGRMSIMLTGTTETVGARVSLSLTGPPQESENGSSVPNVAYIDDVSLARARVGVGISASSSYARSGSRVVLRGSVTPTMTVGGSAKVYVQRPGRAWALYKTVPITAAGDSGVWSAAIRFEGSSRRGTYRFRTSVAGVPGYLGSTSRTASVTLR